MLDTDGFSSHDYEYHYYVQDNSGQTVNIEEFRDQQLFECTEDVVRYFYEKFNY